MRFQRLPREAAAVCILRKQGLSIGSIAKFLGRSKSFVDRILIRNVGCGIRYFDLRTLKNQSRIINARTLWTKLQELRLQWEAWMLGEGERPP